jgi:hypothetical protein
MAATRICGRRLCLTLPTVLAAGESPAKNSRRQIAARAGEFEGTLRNITVARLDGWLFQPANAGAEILIVPPKTTRDRIPTRTRRFSARGLPTWPRTALISERSKGWGISLATLSSSRIAIRAPSR